MSVEHCTNSETQENWRPVRGFEGLYDVSDLGNVRRWFDRWRGRLTTPVALKQSLMCRGYYWTVHLKTKTHYVHVLVLEAFVGLRPAGMDALHGPGGTHDNRVSNLSWGTVSKNLGEDRARDGTDMRGEKHHNHKFTEADVRTIRLRLACGESQSVVANDYDTHQSVISRINSGKRWGWLK